MYFHQPVGLLAIEILLSLFSLVLLIGLRLLLLENSKIKKGGIRTAANKL